ncbi:hypothetical protein JHN52_13550, partial [Streptomyces sp. MBT97]|nr:hypothetical protein [Streptomyces sp. MBT97]
MDTLVLGSSLGPHLDDAAGEQGRAGREGVGAGRAGGAHRDGTGDAQLCGD